MNEFEQTVSDLMIGFIREDPNAVASNLAKLQLEFAKETTELTERINSVVDMMDSFKSVKDSPFNGGEGRLRF